MSSAYMTLLYGHFHIQPLVTTIMASGMPLDLGKIWLYINTTESTQTSVVHPNLICFILRLPPSLSRVLHDEQSIIATD